MYECYLNLKSILGDETEDFSSVKLVEEYRKFWMPVNIKTILLAESHVFTNEADRAIKLNKIPELIGYPSDYAKFVYCLAYGEKNITNNINHPSRDGTPQFWKIFFSCVNRVHNNSDFEPIQSKTPYRERIKNKIKTLQKMQKLGIWLVDTSIIALYNNGNKPNNKVMAQAINSSWDGYTKDVIQNSNPEHVIIIGKGVAKSIEHELKQIVGNNYSVIAQPNAHLSHDEHFSNFKKYYDLCV